MLTLIFDFIGHQLWYCRKYFELGEIQGTDAIEQKMFIRET